MDVGLDHGSIKVALSSAISKLPRTNTQWDHNYLVLISIRNGAKTSLVHGLTSAELTTNTAASTLLNRNLSWQMAMKVTIYEYRSMEMGELSVSLQILNLYESDPLWQLRSLCWFKNP